MTGAVDFAVGTEFAGIPPSSRASTLDGAVPTADDDAAVTASAPEDQLLAASRSGIAPRDLAVSAGLLATGAVLWVLGGRRAASAEVSPPGSRGGRAGPR